MWQDSNKRDKEGNNNMKKIALKVLSLLFAFAVVLIPAPQKAKGIEAPVDYPTEIR